MVRFYGLCDGKIMVRKTNFFSFCVEMSNFFCKFFGGRYLIIKYHWLITCRLWTEGLLNSILVHGRPMVRVFVSFCHNIENFFKNFQNTLRFVII